MTFVNAAIDLPPGARNLDALPDGLAPLDGCGCQGCGSAFVELCCLHVVLDLQDVNRLRYMLETGQELGKITRQEVRRVGLRCAEGHWSWHAWRCVVCDRREELELNGSGTCVRCAWLPGAL